MLSHTVKSFSGLLLRTRPGAASLAATHGRLSFHANAGGPLRLPYKDTQDRESLKPGSNEHTRSGRDEDVAADEDASYNPARTSPESERDAADKTKGNGGSPLEASGANQELSKPRGDERSKETGAGEETRKGGQSSRSGSGQKKGRPGKV